MGNMRDNAIERIAAGLTDVAHWICIVSAAPAIHV